MVAPLSITLRNNFSGRWLRLDGQVEQVTLSTTVPGGFGTFVFQLSERVARTLQFPLQSFYACDLLVDDQNGTRLFEGQLTDVKQHSDATDSYFECEATGWQILLDNPYRSMPIERNLPFDLMQLGFFPTNTRPDVIIPTIGQVDPADATKIGVRFDVQSGRAITLNWLMGVQCYFPVGTRITRLKYDETFDTLHTAGFTSAVYGINDAGANINGTALDLPGGPTSYSGDFTTAFNTLDCRGFLLYIQCTTAGTTSAAISSVFSNIRVLGRRRTQTGQLSDQESVFGHELVADVVSQSGLSQDFSGIEIDNSYAVPEFSYPTSDTGRNALDLITGFYSKYWAVYEGKRIIWKTWNPAATADWVVSRDNGAQVDIDPSITNAARVARVQYTDPAGIPQELDTADAAQDNVYTLAGASKTAIVNLGITTTASAAAQIGKVYFPDHSYEVVGGTITLDARTRCYSQTYGTMLPAYRIRAGESVRIRDGNSVRGVFGQSSWDRATVFRITATDLDWDNQVIKLTCDNSQASLDQLLSQIQTNLSSKYGL